TNRFREGNPKLYQAFLGALEEATRMINADKREAAAAYTRISRDPSPPELIQGLLTDPENAYTTDPLNLGQMVAFMHRTGSIRVAPERWQDLFFPNMHDRPGR